MLRPKSLEISSDPDPGLFLKLLSPHTGFFTRLSNKYSLSVYYVLDVGNTAVKKSNKRAAPIELTSREGER